MFLICIDFTAKYKIEGSFYFRVAFCSLNTILIRLCVCFFFFLLFFFVVVFFCFCFLFFFLLLFFFFFFGGGGFFKLYNCK